MKYLSIIAAFLFLGCSVTKQNQKAVNRVKADINLLNDVGYSWRLLNPCIPDTLKVGKTVTIIDSSFAQENINFLNGIIDSLLDKNCPTANTDSLKKAIAKEVAKNCKPITYNHYRVDTIPDKREIPTLNTLLQNEKDNVNKLTGENIQLKAQVKSAQSTSSKKTWVLIGAGLIILFLAYLLIKPKMK